MHHRYLRLLVLALVGGFSIPAPGQAQEWIVAKPGAKQQRAERAITQLIVRYREDQSSVVPLAGRMQSLSTHASASLSYKRAMSGGAHVLTLPGGLSRAEAHALAKRMQTDPAVAYVEPDDWVYPSAEPSDPLYLGTVNAPKGQWYLKDPTISLNGYLPGGAANFPAAWDTTTGSGVTVAVIDTGVVPHADLGNNVVAGYDFVSSTTYSNDGNGRDADPTDPGDWVAANECGSGEPAQDSTWHGTHVAGIIAALAGNGSGGVGGAHGARVLNVRAMGKCGGYTSDIIDAMRWSAGLSVNGLALNKAHVARIINLSLGAAGACSQSFQAAIDQVRSVGAMVVAATGNDAGRVGQPANCRGVMAVTAHSYEGDNADYANVGAETRLSAPGGGACTLSQFHTCSDPGLSTNDRTIWSTVNSGKTTALTDTWAGYQGTSVATPHVSAAAALLLARQSSLSSDEIESLLTNSARSHPAGSYCAFSPGWCGSGMLDVSAAVARLGLPVPRVTASTPATWVTGGNWVTLTGTAMAQTGGSGTFSYQWTQVSGPAVSLQDPNAASSRFVAPSPGGPMLFRLTVTDGNGYSTAETVNLYANNVPTLGAIAVQVGTAGSAMNFTLSATDPENDSLTYVAVGLPPGAALNAASGAFSWASPQEGSYSFSVYASDGYADGPPISISLLVSAAPGSVAGGGSVGGLGLVLLLLAGWAARRNRLPG